MLVRYVFPPVPISSARWCILFIFDQVLQVKGNFIMFVVSVAAWLESPVTYFNLLAVVSYENKRENNDTSFILK